MNLLLRHYRGLTVLFSVFLGLVLNSSNDAAEPSPATLKITRPEAGAILPAEKPVEVSATAIDPNGYIPRVEFFVDSTRFAVSEIAFLVPPPDGTPIQHTVIWTNPPPGEHVLKAVAKDSLGRRVESPGVHVTVDGGLPAQTVVRITTIDPEGTELPPFVDAIDPIRFEIRREGPTNNAVRVFFSLHGTARPEADYRDPGTSIEIAAGARSADLYINPTPDLLTVVEPMETVAVRLEPSPLATPVPTYVIDAGHAEAVGVIYEQRPPEVGAVEIALPDNGTTVPANTALKILAAAYHPSVDFLTVEFYADETRIGDSAVVADKATSGGLFLHSFTWTHPTPGAHVLTARAILPDGTFRKSSPVQIKVEGEPGLPVVSIYYHEPETDQPWPNADYAPGVLEIKRTGPTNDSLQVFFDVGGTASPGLDYPRIDPHYISIPAGAGSAFVKVEAIDDAIHEETETVLLTLIASPLAKPPTYSVDSDHASAAILIYDNDPAGEHARIELTRPKDGDIFKTGQEIPMNAVAIDPNGYIPRVEFQVDGRTVGVSEILFLRAPDPGTPIYHTFVWKNATAGEHIVRVISTDSRGQFVVSNSAKIVVRDGETQDQVVLTVEARDSEAWEAGPADGPDPAVFVIRRVAGKIDVPVNVYYALDGPAQNGVDFEKLNGQLLLPSGARTAEVVIRPIPDKALEGDETVVLRLQPPVCVAVFPPPPDCYAIGEPGSAHAVIHEGTPFTNGPVQVTIVEPKDGSVIHAGETIRIRAEVTPSSAPVEALTLFADEHFLTAGKSNSVSYLWADAAPGTHLLKAAVLSGGVVTESPTVHVLVSNGEPGIFVRRELPSGYTPGNTVTVLLRAEPPEGARAWTVEDLPPRGWTVTRISDEGALDPATGRVKFGFFTSDANRTLTYDVKAPAEATGRYEFAGSSAVNGREYPVGGDRIIDRALRSHPADLDQNLQISQTELTGYAAAWKGGESWAVPPSTIPQSYVTRAALIWRRGEKYHYDAEIGAAPLCWVPDLQPQIIARDNSAAIRSHNAQVKPGEAFEISIFVQPSTSVQGWTLEETVPDGWTFESVSNEGMFDPKTRTLRWGLFIEHAEQILHYTLRPPAGVTSVAPFRGVASFDGANVTVAGVEKVIAVEGSAHLQLGSVAHDADGRIHLRLNGPAGQRCVLEASSDLKQWNETAEMFLPEGTLDWVQDTAPGQNAYYRLRVR